MTTNQTKQQPKLATLAIDIGGTGIKMMVLDSEGHALTEHIRALTPKPAKVKTVCALIEKMIKGITVKFDRVSSGFPGVVIHGVVMTAANLHSSWINFDFQAELQRITGCPARVANDADVQGLGDISGKGTELVITLGTGMGSALFHNGILVPNLQLGHHPFKAKKTYEDLLGIDGLKKNGVVKWCKHLKSVIDRLQVTFNYDQLYIGGGNAKKINFELPSNVKISNNIEGILGGLKLWTQ